MKGFAGVNADGPNTVSFESPYIFQRTDNPKYQPTLVTLAPGAKAVIPLFYYETSTGDTDTCNGDNLWTPTKLVVTAPDDTKQLSIAWPAGPMDNCDDAATHPASYVAPVAKA